MALGVGAVVATAALAGCKVGQDYEAPTPEHQVGRIASTDTAPAEAAGIASGRPVVREWWQTLRDERLDALVASLVESNLDLQAAQARVREARAQRGIAASALYPWLDVGGQAGVGRTSNDDWRGALQYSIGFDALWELDLFGGLRRGVEAADAQLASAVELRRDVLVSLLGELGRAYVELRAQQRQLEIARRNVGLQERTLELVTIRRRSGLASELQVAQVASLLESTRADVPRLETLVARSIYRIGVLLGREPQALLAELGAPAPIPLVPPSIPVGLPSDLLVRRPDLRAAERAMAAACARAGVARADLYPRFALTGTIRYAGTHGVDGTPSFFVGPTVSWPIFNGFRIVSNIAMQDARLEQAVLAYRAAILNALEEVENAITAFANELIRRDVLARAAREAERAEGLAQRQYRSGLADFLNVLEAQRTLASSQQALARSEQDLLVNLIAVYKALGGGWDVFEVGIAEREVRPPETELPR